MDLVRSVLRLGCIGATILVALGFVLFATGEARDGSSEQIARVDDATALSPSAGEGEREQENGALREFVDDANDVLLSPFENVASSDDDWVTHGVPALLALLVYGLGGMVLLNYALPRRR